MNRIYLTLLLLTIKLPDVQAFGSDTSFIHRQGQSIIDGQGAVVHLNGVNLGGWLLWEAWIWGGGFTQEKTIYGQVQAKLGTAAADAFRDSIYKNFITRNDIKKISEQCHNVVRIAFNHQLLDDDWVPFVYKSSGWQVLDSVLKWCEDYNVYAVLDMHAAPGGQSPYFISDPDFIKLWDWSFYQERTVRMWKAIADRYKNRGIVAGYDILNEPIPPSDSVLLNLYKSAIDSIRSVDTNHLIFLEGTNFAQDFTMFKSLPDSNSAFEFHFYPLFNNNISQTLSTYTALSQNLNVPVWCGEWGENNYATLDTILKYFNSSSLNISGSAFWTWKKVFNSNLNPCYACVDTFYLWDKTIAWISNGFSPEPTVAEMQQGIDTFLENIKLQNCNFNGALNDILQFCNGVGIAQYHFPEDDILIFPNPASDVVTIKKRDSDQVQLSIFNTIGEQLYDVCFTEEKKMINLKNYPDGVYFIRLTSTRQQSIKKLIVNKNK